MLLPFGCLFVKYIIIASMITS